MMSKTDFSSLTLSEPGQDVHDYVAARRGSKEFPSSLHDVRIAKGGCGKDYDTQEFEAPSLPAIDLEALMERCMDDFDLVVEVIESFCEQCLSRVRSLDQALQSAQTEQINFDLDFLSGAAKNVGAEHLAESIARLAHAVQKAIEAGNVPGKDDEHEDDVTMTRSGSSLGEGWRSAFAETVLEFQRAVKYWKDFRVQTGNDEEEDMASTLRLESYLATCVHMVDSGEYPGSNWSATEDELAQQQHIVDEVMTQSRVIRDAELAGYSPELYDESADWSSLEVMDMFFEGSKQLSSHLRECWITNRRQNIKESSEQMLFFSTRAGLTTLCRKLQALVDSGAGPSLRACHIDAVEQQLDASIAIWSSCRLKI